MPTYSYHCPSCSYHFNLEKPAELSGELTFCLRCWNPAKRLWQTDLPTVSITKARPTTELETPSLDRVKMSCGHYHAPGETCALSVDWDNVADKIAPN